MKKTFSSFLILLSLSIIVIGCKPFKNEAISFKTYSSPKVSSRISLTSDYKFYYNHVYYGEGISLSSNVKGSYRIKKNRITFYPEEYLEKPNRLQREQKKAPILSPKVNGVFLVKPKRGLSTSNGYRLKWLECSEEYINYFQVRHNYSIKRDSIWKLYNGDKLKYHEFESPFNSN